MSLGRPSLKVGRPAVPPAAGDARAEAEHQAFKNEDLERDAREQDHGRKQNLYKNVHYATIVLFWIAVVSLGLMMLGFVSHLLLPKCRHFIPPDQLDIIKSLLVGAAASSVMTGYARKLLGISADKPDG